MFLRFHMVRIYEVNGFLVCSVQLLISCSSVNKTRPRRLSSSPSSSNHPKSLLSSWRINSCISAVMADIRFRYMSGINSKTTRNVTTAVMNGRRQLCLRDKSVRRGDCVYVHNKLAWRTRRGMSPEQLRQWKWAYDYFVKITRLGCLRYAGKRSGSVDLSRKRTKKYYLKCIRKALKSRRRSIRLLDGTKFSAKDFLVKGWRGNRRISLRRLVKKGYKRLCRGDRRCKQLNRSITARSFARLNSYQLRWWKFIYSYNVEVAARRCELGGRKLYQSCVNKILEGKAKDSMIRTLYGMLYSWENVLKIPSSMKPLGAPPRRVAPSRQPTRRILLTNKPARGSSPSGPSKVKLICDDKGCRTVRIR